MYVGSKSFVSSFGDRPFRDGYGCSQSRWLNLSTTSPLIASINLTNIFPVTYYGAISKNLGDFTFFYNDYLLACTTGSCSYTNPTKTVTKSDYITKMTQRKQSHLFLSPYINLDGINLEYNTVDENYLPKTLDFSKFFNEDSDNSQNSKNQYQMIGYGDNLLLINKGIPMVSFLNLLTSRNSGIYFLNPDIFAGDVYNYNITNDTVTKMTSSKNYLPGARNYLIDKKTEALSIQSSFQAFLQNYEAYPAPEYVFKRTKTANCQTTSSVDNYYCMRASGAQVVQLTGQDNTVISYNYGERNARLTDFTHASCKTPGYCLRTAMYKIEDAKAGEYYLPTQNGATGIGTRTYNPTPVMSVDGASGSVITGDQFSNMLKKLKTTTFTAYLKSISATTDTLNKSMINAPFFDGNAIAAVKVGTLNGADRYRAFSFGGYYLHENFSFGLGSTLEPLGIMNGLFTYPDTFFSYNPIKGGMAFSVVTHNDVYALSTD